jgi:Uma2 family endonuclease
MAQQVEVYRREAGALAQVATLGAGQTLTSPALAGFGLPIADLFRLPDWFPQ